MRGHAGSVLINQDGEKTPLIVADNRVAKRLNWEEIDKQTKKVVQ